MDANDSTMDQPTADADSTGSEKRLILDDQQRQQARDVASPVKKKSKQKVQTPIPTTPDNKPTFRGPFGISIAATIIWYVCICILFVIGFISLILSILYYVTSTSDESVIKLYGIAGAGTLTVITFIIIFLDCCNDGGRKDHEQEALYLAMKEKEERERELAARRARRIAEGKEEAPKPFIIQHQRPTTEPTPSPSPTPTPPPHHHHHLVFPPPTMYHHPFVCPVCHDLHASGNARHNLADVAVDTSDKLLDAKKKKSNRTVLKSTRDAQTDLYDTEQGTQTDRNEGTQTSAMELSGMPSNISQVIHETTIIKAPRSLLPTLKRSMAEQDKQLATNRTGANPTFMTATIV